MEQLPAMTFDRIDGTAVYTSPQVQSLLGYTMLVGGTVDLRSHPGRGTTVAFTIPLRAA